MIKLLLIDDEQPALDELEYLIKDYSQLNIVGKFTEPKKALEYILLHEVDAVFLDISMPEIDGFALAEAIIRLRQAPHIIFATAYDEYAIKAFEVNAIDYLVKPITTARLDKTIQRLHDIYTKSKLQQEKQVEVDTIALKQMLQDRYVDNMSTRIPLWKNDRIHLINPDDISYIETNEGETKLYTKKGMFLSSESLSHYETILSSYHFYRCHRSYLIHIDHISEIIPWFNNTYAVKISGYDLDIPISRRNTKEFKDLLHL
jgi:DNA-binding LytR/AlgR family response regulator